MDLRCHHFEFCPEVTAKACRLGLNILEVPISYDPGQSGRGRRSDARWRGGTDHPLATAQMDAAGAATATAHAARHFGIECELPWRE